MMIGYYVTAICGRRVAWLCGPFETHSAALRMVEPVRRAANRTDDPRFAFAAFGTSKREGRSLPPGNLDLKFIEPNDVLFAINA